MFTKKDQTSSNRIKPKSNNSKSGIKDDTKPVRFSEAEYKARQDFILAKESCQCCGEFGNLDTPHHAEYGLGKKDDRYLVNICLVCHWEIHSGSYDNLPKTREELKVIGWLNHLEYMDQA